MTCCWTITKNRPKCSELFSVYTICISEQYRAIVSYSPTPGQQASAILWIITIIFWLQSQVHCVTFFLLNVWHFYITKYRNTLHSHYFFVPGRQFWTTGRFKVLADCQWFFKRANIISSKLHNISKGECDILVIIILLFVFSFFDVEIL